MSYTHQKPKQGENEYGLIYELGSLYDYFNHIDNSRSRCGRQYFLATLLIWMMLAKLCGEDKPISMAEWIAHRKELWMEYQLTDKARTASHMTYRRVLQDTLNAEEFEQMIKQYHQQKLSQGQEIVLSMYGKAIRGTFLLAIYVPQQGLVLAQASIDRKENEIVVAPHLLRQVSLAGTIVIADAMHTCSQVIEAGGDYVLTAEDNQARTRWAIEKLFVNEICNLQKGAPLSQDFQMAVKTEKR